MTRIFLNGKITDIKSNISLATLLERLKDTLPKVFVIELNMQIIKKEKYEFTYLQTGDRVEIVQFCGGG